MARSGLVLVLVLLAVGLVTVPTTAQSIDKLVAQSQLIFRGTIVKLGASTVREVPVRGNMAIVRVDEVIESASAYRNLNGRNVTVALKDAKSARAGEKRTFFTASWLFGEGIAVREVGSLTDGATTAPSASDTAAARRRIADAELRVRLARAVQVVQGEVVSVRPATPGNPPPDSEHDPQWWLATIRVDQSLKGAGGNEVVVAFPSSTDVVWARAPKFVVGQKALWILRHPDLPGVALPQYLIALERDDVQPIQKAPRIRQLLK
jgi:hypothetical protein